jgi:hypothetical protein
MPKYLLDLGLDGCYSDEELKDACDIFIKGQLSTPDSILKFEYIEETEDGPTAEQLIKLWNTCRKFVDEYKPSCPESICQVDEISLACGDFVEEICDCVGYYKDIEES